MSFRGGRGRGRGGRIQAGPLANDRDTFAELQKRMTTNAERGSSLYPERVIPRTKPLTDAERLQVQFMTDFVKSMQNDTAYCIATTDEIKARSNAGDGIERYSDRWRPKRKVAHTLQDLHIDETFLPDELLPVVWGTDKGRKRKRQKIDINTFIAMKIKTEDGEEPASGEAQAQGQSDAESEVLDDEDDDFNDEDGEGNDYGENYFDNGEEDDGGYEGGGDEGEL